MILPRFRQLLNRMNSTASAVGLGRELDRSEAVICVEWNQAVQGGTAGAGINLGFVTEEACLVTRVLIHEVTNVVGATSTYTVRAGTTALTGDIAVASLATGTIALAGSATAIPVAAGQPINLLIGTANATAGLLRIYISMVPQRTM